MTISELLTEGSKELKPFSSTPRLDAEVLLAHALEKGRENLFRDRDEKPSRSVEAAFRSLLSRRRNREPVHYIVGQREFWSLPFKVDHGVLIPRPETELVVETALRIFREQTETANGTPVRIVDLGTGSGNIAVALAGEIDHCVIYAVDASHQALECARENIENNGVSDKVKLLWGDLFEPLPPERCRLDMIVSNPPYVSSAEMEELQPEVRDYEPRQALHGGGDGLHYLRRIIDRSPEYLKPGGALVLEIGCGRGEAVLRLMEERGAYHGRRIDRDYAGLDRVVSGFV